MITFFQACVSGLSVGCMYGLIALGFVLIYKATESINFAQGDLVMLGALIAHSMIDTLGVPYWISLPCAIAVMMLVGYLLDALVVRRLVGKPQFTTVMLTFGIGAVIRMVAGWIWGYEPLSFASPFYGRSVGFAGVEISYDSLAMIVGTGLLSLALWIFFRWTRSGLMIQASSQNQLAAYYCGLDVRKISSRVWALSAGIAGLAGVLLAPVTLADPNMGSIGLKAFAAAVLGGMGSIPGALIGGVAVGVIEQVGGVFLPDSLNSMVVFAALFITLIFRPSGLFAQLHSKKV